MQRTDREAGQYRTDYRPDHGHRSIVPSRAALTGDRKYGVRDTRPQVASGVDRIARRSAERYTDAPDQETDEEAPGDAPEDETGEEARSE